MTLPLPEEKPPLPEERAPLPDEKTQVGSYFVSNYPPFSFWRSDCATRAHQALREPGESRAPLGLYLHIPFCRKRCKFCYFRVYTDKNSREIERYIAALTREVELYSALPAVAGRKLGFVYFGGGTPSYLSAEQLLDLVDRLREFVDWNGAEEVTFECEPGTLTRRKLEAIRDIGVTRLSLGVENLDDRVLEKNGRAHRAAECLEAYGWARDLGFEQINIDLIAGMVGETDENWQACVKRTLELQPDCLTVYQMELPFNTIFSKEGAGGSGLVADWKTKREWVDHAFQRFEAVGYSVSSAYTIVRDPSTRFIYRDALWHGADMIGAGVSSFGHFSGVHMQNLDGFVPYIESLEAGDLPISRALPVTRRQRMIREFILQLKTGRIEVGYFRDKFSLDPCDEFREALATHTSNGLVKVSGNEIRVTRSGLLRIDSLLEPFFEPEHQNARYT